MKISAILVVVSPFCIHPKFGRWLFLVVQCL